MGTSENYQAWSTVAATNANADSSVNWAEGQDAATVNNSSRSMMAATAKYIDDVGGAIAAGGTANELTATTNQVLSTAHLTYGLRLAVIASLTNTSGTVTLAVDGLSPAPIVRADGIGLLAGDIQAGMILDLFYHLGSSHWRCANITPSGAAKASFYGASALGQAITTTSATQVSFNTVIDNGAHFAASIWTPPAGMVFMQAHILARNDSASASMQVTLDIYGGVLVARAISAYIPVGQTLSVDVPYLGRADGSTLYNVVASSNSQPYAIVGSSVSTFLGYMI